LSSSPRVSWRGEPSPESLFRDSRLASLARAAAGSLTADGAGGATLFAVPISDDKPFAMTPIFCLGTPQFIGGSEYLVFTLRGGEPSP
jgi:hypothetical protein